MTSSWSVKDIDESNTTFHEACYTGTASKRVVWVILDLQAEDPRGQNNAFRVPAYMSLDSKKMEHLRVYTINDYAT